MEETVFHWIPVLLKTGVKQNNLKTNIRYRYIKDKPPKNDPDCQIGIFPTFVSGKKKIDFFWGYRNHIINDAASELPLIETTLPANVRGTSVVLPQLQFVKEQLFLEPSAVIVT